MANEDPGNAGFGPKLAEGVASRETTAASAIGDKARALLVEFFDRLGLDCGVGEVGDPVDGRLVLSVTGADSGRVIGRHGQTIDAIEYLLNLMVGRVPGSPWIGLDVDGYRARRQESLEELARRSAQQARETGRAIEMSPMNARDRRVIHLALQEASDVSTRSEGEGPHRRVIVEPSRSLPPGRPGVR